MKIKVDDIKPGLPGETLRKIDKFLASTTEDYSLSKIGKSDCEIVEHGDKTEILPVNYRLWPFPHYTTSIDAALRLCERMGKRYTVTLYSKDDPNESPYEVYIPGKDSRCDKCQSVTSNSVWEYTDSFSDLPCAAIRALLRSQNISKIQI